MKPLFRILFATLLALIFSAATQAAQIQVSSITLQNWQDSHSAVELRIYANDDFVDAAGFPHLHGAPGSSLNFQRVTCAVNAGAKTLTIPAFTITSTTDAQDNTLATYYAAFYTINNALIQVYAGFNDFRVPALYYSPSGCSPSGTCVTWADIREYNTTKVLAPDYSTFTKDVIEQKIQAALGTINLNLNSGGGLSKTLGAGSNELGIAAGGVTNAMLTGSIADSKLQTISTAGKVADTALSSNVSLLGSSIDLGTSEATGTLAAGRFPALTGDVTTTAGSLSTALASIVTAGTNTKITFDAKGRVTAAAQAQFSDIGGTAAKAQLPGATIYNDAGNIYSTGAQDFGSATSLKVPTGASAAPSANGLIAYDSTANAYKFGVNGSTKTVLMIDGSGANLTSLNASNLSSGTVPLGRLSGITNTEISSSAAIADSKLATISTAGKVSDSALSSNVPLKNSPNTFSAAQTFSAGTITGSASQILTYDPAANITATGSAPMLLEPTFSYTNASQFRSVGIMVRPQTFGTTTGGTAIFWTPFNSVLGTSAASIPSGTKGQLGGFEANIDTSQAASDLLAGESGHGFGATITTRGGAPMSALNAAMFLTTTAVTGEPGVRGINISFTNNAPAGSLVYGTYMQQAGSQPGAVAHKVTGTWSYGIDLAGMTANNAAIRLKNAAPIVGRTADDSSDIPIIYLNADNKVQVGNDLVNNGSNPFFQVGNTSAGWLFQKVDSDDRIRLFKQGGGEYFSISSSGVVTLAGQLKVAAGTSSLPPVARGSDASQGIYFDGTGTRIVQGGNILATFANGGGVTFHFSGPSIPNSGQYVWGDTGLGRDIAAFIKPTDGGSGAGGLTLNEMSANPANPTQDTQAHFYLKGDKLIVQWNNGGTVRYFTLSLVQSGATATWEQSTSAP